MFLKSQKENFFDKLFPLPNFLEVPAVGVDISDGSIKFLELIKTKGSLRVGHFGEKFLQDGLVSKGEIKDRQGLVSVLKEIKKETGFSAVNVSLPEEKAFLFKVSVPKADDESIRTNLSFQLEKKVPISLAEAVFDYDILSNNKKKGDMVSAVVTVFPSSFVESYLAVFAEAGIKVLSLEIEAQAVARAVIADNDPGTYLVVDFGHRRSGLAVVSKNAVVYTSTLEVGGDNITRKIKEIMKVTDKEVNDIKNDIGFTPGKNAELYEAIGGTIFALKDEINKHYNYWSARAEEGKEDPIQKIILCGGNSNIAGLRDHLASSMKVPVVKANVWNNLFSFDNYVPPVSFRDSASFSTAIGLALASAK